MGNNASVEIIRAANAEGSRLVDEQGVVGDEKNRGGFVVGSVLTRTDIIAQDVSYDFGVCLEHHLLMRVEAPTQAREVDDDHAFRHDGQPFAARGRRLDAQQVK
jgi:hypothetical protein